MTDAQPDLFTRLIHYQQTSREAWEAWIPDQSDKLDNLILACLAYGALTCEAIETKLNRSHQAVSGNMRHLVERGLVVASGEFGQTRSGRRAIKWRLARQ